MKRLVLGLLALGLSLAAAGQARAGFTATYTVDGVATGTFLGQSFTNAAITYTFTYDTDNASGGYFGTPDRFPPFLQPWGAGVLGTGTVEVSGVGSAGLGAGRLTTYSSDSYNTFLPSDLELIFAGTSVRGPFVMGGSLGNPFADYDLKTPIGPVALGFGPPPLPTGTLYTDAGDLVITDVQVIGKGTNPWIAQLQISPEPSSWLLLCIGSLCVAGYGWWRRRAGAARLS